MKKAERLKAEGLKNPLAKALRDYAHDIARIDDQPLVAEDRGYVVELVRVLARVVEGKPIEDAFGAPGDWGYGTPIGDGLQAWLENMPVADAPWIAVSDEVPTDFYSVLGWVTGGPLVVDDPFADRVTYDPSRKVWLQSIGTEDAIVPVSHWMPIPAAPATKGGAS